MSAPELSAMTTDLAELDMRLLQAHELDDRSLLAELYQMAGNLAERSGNIDAACFYLIHALVFALDSGSTIGETIRPRLVAYGREE